MNEMNPKNLESMNVTVEFRSKYPSGKDCK